MTDEIKVCSSPVFSEASVAVTSEDNQFYLVGVTSYLWEIGKTLRVRFLDGEPTVQSKVEEIAHQWSQFANIKFKFSSDAGAEIRISFALPGSWSQIGTSALRVDSSKPTMNFGWLTPTSSDEEYSRVVLHEFGHALGFTHEHKHPEAGIKWNREAVIAYYRRTQGWDEEKTRINVLQAESKDETQYSNFDRDSIMLYPIPAELTTDGFSVGWNTQFSSTDKQFARSIYPFYDLDVAIGGENVLYYERSAGTAVISNNSSIGGRSFVRRYTGFRTTWRHIVYLDSNIILFYDGSAGEGEFYSIDAQVKLSLIRKYTGFRTTWRHIVYLGSNMILFYDGDVGEGEIYRFNGSAELSLLRKYTGWRTTWEKIIGAGGRITFIESGTGHSESYSVDSAGNLS